MGSNTRQWGTLDRWTATAFLIAGVLLTGSTTAKALAWFTDVTVPGTVVALLALPGLTSAIIGLFGLYHRLAEGAPRLSLAAAVVSALAGLTVVVNYGWVLLDGVLSASVGADIPATPPAFVLVTLVATLGLGFGLFGVASLYTDESSDPLGSLLGVFAATWFVIVVAGVASGGAAPEWVYFLAYATQPVSLFTIGYALRSASDVTGHAAPADELVVD